MSIMQAIIVFAVSWWLILFIALPIGIKPAVNPEVGHAPSAPDSPNLRRKFKWVTVVALVSTVLAYFLLSYSHVTL